MTPKELREKRAALAAQAFELTKTAMTAETRTQYDAIMADVTALKGDIDRAEQAAELDAELRSSVRPPLDRVGAAATEGEQRAAAHKVAFDKFIRKGDTSELRTYSPMSDSVEGAFIVPQGFQNSLVEALKAFGGVRQVASSISTATGNDLKWPTANDTNNIGEQLSENTAAGQANPSFSNLTLKAWTYSTKMVNVSNQLLQDSAFDVEGYLRKAFVNRIGRIQNQKFTIGVGTTEPKGINAAATAGPTSGTTLLVSYDDMVELEHSVDPAYRLGAKYMLSDAVLKQIKKLKDTQGHPLWVPGVAVNAPDKILGYEYVINQDMPAVASGANLMLFGALDSYLIRDVKELAIIRLSERFAELFQTAFVGFARADANLIDAGTHPIKALVSL
jgi:HK97 family phage major capsid protein